MSITDLSHLFSTSYVDLKLGKEPGDLDRYLDLIAAVELRTSNRKGRHLSASEAIRLLLKRVKEAPKCP